MIKYIIKHIDDEVEEYCYCLDDAIETVRKHYCKVCLTTTELDNNLLDVLDCECGKYFIIELER